MTYKQDIHFHSAGGGESEMGYQLAHFLVHGQLSFPLCVHMVGGMGDLAGASLMRLLLPFVRTLPP